MNTKSLSCVLAALALAACGGSSGNSGLGVTRVSTGDLVSVALTSEGADTAEVTGLSGGTDTYNLDPDGPFNGFAVYSHTEDGKDYVVLVDKKSQVFAYLGAELANPSALGTSGTRYGRRNGNTTLPSSGTAFYDGNYIAVEQETNSDHLAAITGNVTLSADFSAMQVSGVIFNRVWESSIDDPSPISDVALSSSTISSGGTFSGSATVTTGENPSNGTYQGLLGGADAVQAAGSVSLENAAGTRLETGVFTAAQ